MIINIKQAILEGYSYIDILEAVHAGDSKLDKRNPHNKSNRNERASEHKEIKRHTERLRNSGEEHLANAYDNNNRAASQLGVSPKYTVSMSSTLENKSGKLTDKPLNIKASKYLKSIYNNEWGDRKPGDLSIMSNIVKREANLNSKPRVISSAKK